MEDIGIFGMIDFGIANDLGVDVETYNEVIETKCTYWESLYIVTVFLDQRYDKMDNARKIFNHRMKNGNY